MATKTLEARFEHLSVKDENDSSSNGSYHSKQKVQIKQTGLDMQNQPANFICPGPPFYSYVPIRPRVHCTAEQQLKPVKSTEARFAKHQ